MAYSPIFLRFDKNNQRKHWLFGSNRRKIERFPKIANDFTGYFAATRHFR